MRFALVLTAVAAAMLFIVRAWIEPTPSWDLPIIAFLLITTGAVYFALSRRRGGDPEKFTQLYLLSITIKILLAAGFVVTFIMIDRENAEANAVLFLVGYVLFTVIEVLFLVLKRPSVKP